MSICRTTGLAIPECSCRRCLEDQVRRFRPMRLAEVPTQTAAEQPAGRRLAA